MNLADVPREKLSPMMQQYAATKEKYNDCIVFFRLGDFYEMFFDDALEGERTQLLTELADAVSETRTAADQAAELTETGETGLLRLVEILCAAKVQRGQAGETVLEGTEVQILADVVAQLYACLTECRFVGPMGLAAYAELSSMVASLMLGEWFE